MVASRLVNLVSKVDLSHVRQILDIGSRDLQQSLEFLNIFPNAAVDAFEPVPESFAVCMQRKNNILHTHTNAKINCHNLVLSDRKGTIPFYSVVPELSSTPNVGASSMFPFIEGLNGTPFGQNLVQKEIVVESTTLDSWCKENNISEVDIMWIDVQGAELLVMMGGQSILPKTKIIMTEIGLKPYYEGHTLKPEIDALLKELGFEELVDSFELNSFDYEANTIYINTKFQ